MSTYRSRLEAGVHPSADPRRAADLRAQLRRLAASLSPRWRPTGQRDDFGSALLQIGARLAEETTRRLDQTARRDALAFFDLLGLAPSPPQAATGVLVMALEESHTRPVYAPARTQAAVATDDGEEITFETQVKLRVVPGRIGELFAVDPETDRIQLAPARVTSTDPPAARPGHYQVVSFAGTSSRTLQLSPSTGLVEHDALRIEASVYRVRDADKNGLVTLLDPLEAPAPAGTTATRAASFESFNMRDLQQHVFYVGHTELLNLKQRARVVLDLVPASLAREMSQLDVTYWLYGTREGQNEPAWHPLDLLSTTGSKIRLAKPWIGPVEETEIHGHKSRWLRATLQGKVLRRPSPTSRASSVRLTVASVDDHAAPATASGQGAAGTEEGSRTVVHAAHNSTPLATTRRFFPFGPEPLRFDTFALAAPEALSKKGATATLKVTMVDSSMISLGVVAAASVTPARRAYGVGRNGDLQVLFLDQERQAGWLEVSVAAEDGRRVLLGATPPVAVERVDGGDVVTVADRHGDLWAAAIRSSEMPPSVTVEGAWHPLQRLGATPVQLEGKVPVVAPAPPDLAGTTAIVLDVDKNVLHALKLDRSGQATGTWTALVPADGGPSLSSPGQLTVVQGAGWPARPEGVEVLARDDQNALWVATIEEDATTRQLTASWSPLNKHEGQPTLPPVRADVTPAATRFRPDEGPAHLWVCYAAAATAGNPPGLHGVDKVGDSVTGYPIVAEVGAGSALHANPEVRGVGGLPATAGLSPDRDEVILWQGGEQAARTPLPAAASSGRPLLLLPLGTRPGESAELVLAGTGERVLRAAVPSPRAVGYRLHDLVELESDWAPHLVEITTDPDDPAASSIVELGAGNRRIVHGRIRIYEMDEPALTAGTALRFLRLRKGEYTGAFDPPESRTRLRLDPNDEDTTTGKRLVLGTASYRVTAVSDDRVATLEHPVVAEAEGDETSYRVVAILAKGVVTEAHLRTLAKLETSERPEELVFGPPASPRTQQIRLGDKIGPPVWVRLGDAWLTAPVEGTQAAVTATLSWTESAPRERGYRNPELSWEYYDGEGWQRLETGFLDGTDNLSTTGRVTFVVPQDLTTTDVGGKDEYWIRARLVGGDYGRPTYLVRQETGEDGVTQQKVVVDTSNLHPPEILAIEAGFSSPEEIAPAILPVENNADVLDQTQASSVASASFDLFQGAGAIDPGALERALFAGMTTPIGRGTLVLFVDAVDQPGTGTLRVDLRTPDGWRRVPVDDGTASLRRTGTVALSLDHDPVPVRLLGHDRVWFRFRQGEVPAAGTTRSRADGRPWAPVVRALLLNAVEISQARTVEDEVLGSSLGEPGTTVRLANVPVMPDSVELRVREELSDEERAGLEEERRTSARSGGRMQPPVVLSGLERTPGTWVLWRRVDSFVGMDGDARVYLLDPSTGRVTFGDGRNGKIPPAGRDSIRCFGYQQGGGAVGNLPAWSGTRLTTAVEGVETAVLPVGTAGGVDAPPADSVFATAPQRLRHAGRAMSPSDVEALAVASSGDVVRARCRRPSGPGQPVSIAVVVRGDSERCPRPTYAQLESVAAYVRRAGWGGLAEDSVEVHGPTYVPVTVRADLIAAAERWAEVEETSKEILVDLFHPVCGGPDRSGWPFGRRPTSADLLRALSTVTGIDRVAELSITPLGGSSLDHLPYDGLVCAEAADITVTVTAEGGAS